MSDSPGKNRRTSHDRRRGGNRNNNNRNRPAQRDEMWENHGEEFRLPHRSRFREDERDTKPSPRPTTVSKPSLGRKLLRILSFGLLGSPGAKAPARPQDKKSGAKNGDHPPRQDRNKDRGPRPPREDHPRRQPRQPSPPPTVDPASITGERLHIGNLSYDTAESDLSGLFSGIGKVSNVEIIYNSITHRSKGFGFVQFMSVNDARRAVTELHGKPFMGRNLILGPAKERPARDRYDRRGDDEAT